MKHRVTLSITLLSLQNCLRIEKQKERIIDEDFTLDSIASKIIKQKLQTYIL